MTYKKVKKKNDFNTLYDAARAGMPLTKQALTMIGNEFKEENQINEYEEREQKLNDPKIRYVRDKFGMVHDKSCYRVVKYPEKDLTWMADAGVNLAFCRDCYRKALIRRGLDSDLKRIDDYVKYFDRHSVSNYDMKDMFMVRGCKVRLVAADTLWVKEREDEWKIEYDYDTSTYILWHNSYVISGKKRVATGDYHKQSVRYNVTFGQVLSNILNYSNKLHMSHEELKQEKASAALKKQVEKVVKEKQESVVKEVKTDNKSFSYFDRMLAQKGQVG